MCGGREIWGEKSQRNVKPSKRKIDREKTERGERKRDRRDRGMKESPSSRWESACLEDECRSLFGRDKFQIRQPKKGSGKGPEKPGYDRKGGGE